jgi:hypothetical protein
MSKKSWRSDLVNNRKAWRKELETLDEWLVNRHMIPDDLDRVGQEVKRQYELRKRTAKPGYRVSSRRAPREFWMIVAKRIIERDADPAQFVSQCFETYGNNMWPEVLISYKSLEQYHDTTDADMLRISRQMEAAIKKILFEVKTTGKPPCKVLLDSRLNLNPLLVWCIASREGFDEAAQQTQQEAARLLHSRAFKNVYKQAFPEVIK